MDGKSISTETADQLRASLLASCVSANAAYAARMAQRELYLEAVAERDILATHEAEHEVNRLAAEERNFDAAEAYFGARLREMEESLPTLPPETLARYLNSTETTPRRR